MYDIALLKPPASGLVRPNAQAPLSLLYLAAVAEKAGASVVMPHRHDDTMQRAQIYGISGYHDDVGKINMAARQIKAWNPKSKIVVGGPISLSIDALERPVIDAVVHGPGERAIVDILNGATGDIHGSIEDIDKIPWPARHIWPRQLGGATFLDRKGYPGPSAAILASRGCPNRCAFCANPALTDCQLHLRNPGDVAEEMVSVVMDFGIYEFCFTDEYFNCSVTHVLELCKQIRKRAALVVAWRVTVGARPSTPRLWSEMYKAGCREVSIGIESGDDYVLSAMSKRASVADNEKAIREASEAGLSVRALMMTGTPVQRPDTVEKDIAFVIRNRKHLAKVAATIFVPMPGSEIYEHPERFNCKIRTDVTDKSIASYRPDGLKQVEPHVDVEKMDRNTLRKHMQLFLDFLDATGILYHG